MDIEWVHTFLEQRGLRLNLGHIPTRTPSVNTMSELATLCRQWVCWWGISLALIARYVGHVPGSCNSWCQTLISISQTSTGWFQMRRILSSDLIWCIGSSCVINGVVTQLSYSPDESAENSCGEYEISIVNIHGWRATYRASICNSFRTVEDG